MFEDPSGPKYIGTLAWKTSSNRRKAVAIEHGDVDAKKIDEEHSPERVEYTTEKV